MDTDSSLSQASLDSNTSCSDMSQKDTQKEQVFSAEKDVLISKEAATGLTIVIKKSCIQELPKPLSFLELHGIDDVNKVIEEER
jgi:hypothetical protein